MAYHYPRSRPGYPPGWDGKLADFGKYHYPMFLAQLALKDTSLVRQQILAKRMAMFAQMPTFHFNLVGLPRILFLFSNHLVLKQYRKDFLQRVWERTDSYNPWTAEGTENHISMSKTSAYLYAQLAWQYHRDAFPDAEKKMRMMKDWILQWSKTIYYTGSGEFNSSIYQAYTIIGWLNLFDFAKDTEVKSAARAVLDYYATEMALHYVQGMSGGSDLRGQNCTRSFEGSYAYLAWLWFGDSPVTLTAETLDLGRNTNEAIQTVHAALSQYRPPLAAVALAFRKFGQPAWYTGSKPGYLLDRPGYIKQHLYVSNNYLLGTGYFPYGGWGSGNNQIVSWKLISRVDSGAGQSAQFVSGIGIQSPEDARYAGGNKRSPYDQLAQHKNVLVQLTRLPVNASAQKDTIRAIFKQWQRAWAADFARRFPNDTDKLRHNPIYMHDLDVSVNRSSVCITKAGMVKTEFKEKILFVELEKSLIAIRSVRGDKPDELKISQGGGMQYSSMRAVPGLICGFVLEVAEKKAYASVEFFKQQILQRTWLDASLLDKQNRLKYVSLSGDTLIVEYQPYGTFTEPLFDFGYGVTQPMLNLAGPSLQQPNWPSGEGHGRLARWWVNSKAVDLEAEWPVYGGPGLCVANGVLKLNVEGAENYTVDYRGKIPVFRSN
ncbi:MAG TPA: hypothetical protein PKD90_00815 [Phnomibacter sp.]|nr:hypothetical protein [Phnomibacter sp.]